MSKAKHDQLYQDLIDLKLNHIAEHYREVLDDVTLVLNAGTKGRLVLRRDPRNVFQRNSSGTYEIMR